MAVRLHYDDGVLRAVLSGEIDHHTVQQMRREIDDAIVRTSPKTLVLDVGRITFMDSSGIGLVMGRYRLLSGMGGRIVISGASGKLEKILRIGGLEKIASFEKEGKE